MDDTIFLGFTRAELTVIRNNLVHRQGAAGENREQHLAMMSVLAKLGQALSGPSGTPMSQQILRSVVFPNRKHHSERIAGLSVDMAKKYPMRTNGHTVFTVFTDQSMLAWDKERGYGHDGN